jgi:hypothetical protein
VIEVRVAHFNAYLSFLLSIAELEQDPTGSFLTFPPPYSSSVREFLQLPSRSLEEKLSKKDNRLTTTVQLEYSLDFEKVIQARILLNSPRPQHSGKESLPAKRNYFPLPQKQLSPCVHAPEKR